MSVLLLLIPISLLFVVAGAVAFFWAVNHDQFDDMDTPALLPLADANPLPADPLPADRASESTRDKPTPDVAGVGRTA